ncbi:putative sterigmatocystin biosynthesis monooxygenase stcW [Cyphellophora attinorum]|uniref:Putative sterigmatocystin biosynthesis monooxygenase stcW n=1 Tax=Cyphellophora attinorum TaxID=1664694 RepID=A0A0N1P1J7_9EURO|nr:putative sterigmatocystin biosynthesis monooxygenase stcW [Phialophora attinorum]KPI40796.1 putative sterigmatocystin biosynthesis monooxygenase stcW [Phialophora attinorum]
MAQNRIMTISSTPDSNAIPGEDFVHPNTWYNQDFNGYRVTEHPLYTKRHLRIVCVGAGATGLQIAYKAERILKNVDLQIYEKNHDVGGTWLENRYPGCTCDIPSHSYQFTWHRNPKWSHFYSSSPEIWQYFKDVSTTYNLEKYVQFKTSVDSATWDEESGKWTLSVLGPDGKVFSDTCDILISGSGVLNSWKYPAIPGLEIFQGKLMHSAKWDDSYDLTNKRVAVIGGGSSAVQIIPSIQPKVKKLIPFLRSPVWVTTGFGAKYAGPGGTNFKYSEDQINHFQDKQGDYTKYWVVDDTGVEHEVDVVVCATGFDTSFTPHFKVVGRHGANIQDQFGDFPVGYLGIMARNFPNFFLFIGPNGPASHSSILPILEWYTRYAFQIIEKVQTENIKAFEPKEKCIRDLYDHTHELMKRLVWSSPCRSWFKNGKIHGPVTAIYPGSRLHFFELLKNVRYEDFDISYRTGNTYQFMGNGYTDCEISPDGDPVWYFDDPFTQV